MARDGIGIALVVARARNNVIGAEGGLPWRLRTDMRHFRAVTRFKPVLMGRKTWESLPAPLKDRDTIVLTRDTARTTRGAWCFAALDAALACAEARARARGAMEICVAGGAQIYAETLPIADRLYVTDVDAAPPGDTLFPAFDAAQWREVSVGHAPAGPDDQFAMTFRVLERA